MSVSPPEEIDVYLSYRAADRELVMRLESLLVSAGLSVWSDRQAGSGEDFAPAADAAIAGARFIAFCVGTTGLGQGQLRELTLAEARSASDPDVRFAAVLLPGLTRDFASSTLPLSLQARIWIDLRAGLDASPIAAALASPTTPQAPAPGPETTPSVDSACARLTGEVTAAALVAKLLELHPEYGERRGGAVKLDLTVGEQATAAEWVSRVRERLQEGATPAVHGRLVIAGLARLDPKLKAQLEVDGFLPALEREIREPLDTLFHGEAPAPEETVPTHGDNPATVDGLNREGFGRILAARIRDARAREAAAAETQREPEFPRGRSFLVLLHGRWGIGKTSVLNFLHAELRQRSQPPWVVVTFNAWQHQRLAPPWWWLTTGLYRQAFPELWRISPPRAVLFRLREWLWRLRGGWPGLVLLATASALLVLVWRAGFFASLRNGDTVSYETFKGVIVGIAALLTPLLAVWGVARGLSRWVLTTSARGARFYIDHARDPMQTTKEHFAELVDWIGYPVLVTIDDLDRCKPGFVVELLEGIQTLFRDVPVVYVVAADREWLAACYTSQHPEFAAGFAEPGRPLGYLFLEKTFQLTLAIPVLNEETRDAFWRSLIRPGAPDERAGLDEARAAAARIYAAFDTEEKVRDELARNPGATPAEQQARIEAAAIQLATPKLERAAEHALSPFRSLLDANPRAMKRLVNAYGIGRGVELMNRRALGWDKEAQHRMALWTILSLRWPRLSEYLAEHPDVASAFANGGAAPAGVPDDLVPLFADGGVRAVMAGDGEGIVARLDPESIRLCVST